ncbi:Formin-like protein [Forsythia ovata]|uniref:Formin-like protein n=1 Tax=Forsythia ovata TaxID=205694 RepID=A0ABD1P0M6_9LAMI
MATINHHRSMSNQLSSSSTTTTNIIKADILLQNNWCKGRLLPEAGSKDKKTNVWSGNGDGAEGRQRRTVAIILRCGSSGAVSSLKPPAPKGMPSGNQRSSSLGKGTSNNENGKVKLKPLHWDKVNPNVEHSMV